MASDRDTILGKVNAALAPLQERAAMPDYDAAVELARRKAGEGDRLAEFTARIRAVNGDVASDPAALAALLRAKGWTRGYCDPLLLPLLGPHLGDGFHVEAVFDRGRVDEYQFGITLAAGAIAETGTIILNDATTSTRLGAVAPWAHIAVIPRPLLHADLMEAVAALGKDPNVIWCTGPSKTADVEGILIEGVHGPGAQIALFVD
jgi:L-lactate dehydrogenase complex protein LldG